ncbi:hypothetical protein ACFV80_39765 [Streptomyces sp. NPDC059862]|uniref:hypothetical protein n=1 Tax=Streptomyces sp. NPDC059862 TaxID=3346975 RepID=UPI003652247D
MTDSVEVLGDRAETNYATIPPTALLASVASTTDWIVVVDHDNVPLGALPRACLTPDATSQTALEALRSAPAAVVADVSTPLDALLDSTAFRITAPDAVIAVEDTSIVGLWGGEDLAEEAMHHTSRIGQDWLPTGETIRIPQVVRICQYTAGDLTCTGSLSFHERPPQMPQCPDPGRLGNHDFGW